MIEHDKWDQSFSDVNKTVVCNDIHSNKNRSKNWAFSVWWVNCQFKHQMIHFLIIWHNVKWQQEPKLLSFIRILTSHYFDILQFFILLSTFQNVTVLYKTLLYKIHILFFFLIAKDKNYFKIEQRKKFSNFFIWLLHRKIQKACKILKKYVHISYKFSHMENYKSINICLEIK